jgi:hypothetical protein
MMLDGFRCSSFLHVPLKKQPHSGIAARPFFCVVTERMIQFYFSSLGVFKFSVRVCKIAQGYSN